MFDIGGGGFGSGSSTSSSSAGNEMNGLDSFAEERASSRSSASRSAHDGSRTADGGHDPRGVDQRGPSGSTRSSSASSAPSSLGGPPSTSISAPSSPSRDVSVPQNDDDGDRERERAATRSRESDGQSASGGGAGGLSFGALVPASSPASVGPSGGLSFGQVARSDRPDWAGTGLSAASLVDTWSAGDAAAAEAARAVADRETVDREVTAELARAEIVSARLRSADPEVTQALSPGRGPTRSAAAELDALRNPPQAPLQAQRPAGGWRQAEHGLEGVAQQQAAGRMIERNTVEVRAGLFGDTIVEVIDVDGVADEVERLARVDPVHARGVVDGLAAQVSDNPFSSGGAAERIARDRLETIRQAEFNLDTRAIGVPRRDVDPSEASAMAADLLATSTRRTFLGREVSDASALADGIVALRDAGQPDLAVATWAATRALDPDEALDLDREIADRPYASGAEVLSAPERRWTDIPILSDILGDTIAGAEAIVTGADVVPNRLTGRALSGRDLMDAKVLAFFDVASLGLAGRISDGLRAMDDVVDWADARRLGRAFDAANAHRYDVNQLYVESGIGRSGRSVLDSYNTSTLREVDGEFLVGTTDEIVSRKLTQFSDIQPSTAQRYLNELSQKYSPGTPIANVPTAQAAGLEGSVLQGRQILEVPVQTRPIPRDVLDAAEELKIVIRDVEGTEYR
ncbi:MAG: hypothetical protein AAF366_04015 [Pseudomonadota bacterium]